MTEDSFEFSRRSWRGPGLRFRIVKNGVHLASSPTLEEAERLAAVLEADVVGAGITMKRTTIHSDPVTLKKPSRLKASNQIRK